MTTSDRPLLLLRLVALSALAFAAMVTYAIARPAAESLFLATQTSEGLPLAWLLVALAAVAATAVVGRLLVSVDLLRLYGDVAGWSAALLAVILALRAAGMPAADYALYVWKDIYVVVLVEVLYVLSNTVFPIRTARWAYGLFGVTSALGSVVGNLLVGALAAEVGSERSLLVVVPLLAIMWLACLPLSSRAGARAPEELRGALAGRLGDAVGVVRGSSYLLLVVALIGVVQVVVTLVDLEFNAVAETAFPDTDERTRFIGQVYAVVSASTLVLGALTGPILRLARVPLTLLAVPLLLAAGLVGYVVHPVLLVAALLKVASKAFDYSIFRAAKEILYIPLSFAEKTLGKSFIDVLVYRLAKGAISAVLLVAALFTGVRSAAVPAALVLVAGWVVLTAVIGRRFRRTVSLEEELRAGRRGRAEG